MSRTRRKTRLEDVRRLAAKARRARRFLVRSRRRFEQALTRATEAERVLTTRAERLESAVKIFVETEIRARDVLVSSSLQLLPELPSSLIFKQVAAVPTETLQETGDTGQSVTTTLLPDSKDVSYIIEAGPGDEELVDGVWVKFADRRTAVKEAPSVSVEAPDEAAESVETPATAPVGTCVAGQLKADCMHKRARHVHGTASCYTNCHCRGDACREAKSTYDRSVRDRKNPDRKRRSTPSHPDQPVGATSSQPIANLTQAKLRALIGKGYPVGILARHMNVSRAVVSELAEGTRDVAVDPALAVEIDHAFDDLRDVPPRPEGPEALRATAHAKEHARVLSWPTVADVTAAIEAAHGDDEGGES